MTKRRPVALGAAITLGLGSLLIASPALAADESTPVKDQTIENATDTAGVDAEGKAAIAAAESFAEDTGIEEIIATGTDGEGNSVLIAHEKYQGAYEEASKDLKADADYQVLFSQPAKAYAATDVVGGAGYISSDSLYDYACSIGFSAFTPEGDPAFLSAGHCAFGEDGNVTSVNTLSLPSAEPAVGGAGYEPNGTGPLGDWAFQQFGGADGGVGAENDPNSVDISAVNVTNADLTLLPEVTDWSTAGQDDLAASTTPIKAIADPVSGDVSKAGRTTGLTSGDTTAPGFIDENGNTVEGELLDGWAQISGKWVHGFINDATSDQGDSGGAVFQGDKAVGVVSGGPDDLSWMWASRLKDALADVPELDGYEVALDIDAPVVQSPENGSTIEPGADITVTVPSNAETLEISGEDAVATGGETEVTFPAQDAEGDHTVTLTAANGFSKSESVEFSYTVEVPPISAPTIEDIAAAAEPGQEDAPVTLTGTGEPGATVTINDIWEATVAEDGSWTYDAVFGIGATTVTAVQELNGETSSTATADVTVNPAAPTIDTVSDGESIGVDDAPAAISGTGLTGAEATVTVDGQEYSSAEEVGTFAAVEDGVWTVTLDAPLGEGEHTVEAVQTFNGQTSGATTVTFTVTSADNGNDGGDNDGGDGGDNGNGGGEDGGNGDDGELAVTGSDFNVLPMSLAGIVLLALGAGAVVLVLRQRRASVES